jgi:hypothetical protein
MNKCVHELNEFNVCFFSVSSNNFQNTELYETLLLKLLFTHNNRVQFKRGKRNYEVFKYFHESAKLEKLLFNVSQDIFL